MHHQLPGSVPHNWPLTVCFWLISALKILFFGFVIHHKDLICFLYKKLKYITWKQHLLYNLKATIISITLWLLHYRWWPLNRKRKIAKLSRYGMINLLIWAFFFVFGHQLPRLYGLVNLMLVPKDSFPTRGSNSSRPGTVSAIYTKLGCLGRF